jgi:DNA-binding Lrp family transcriptional regulator
VTRRRWDRPRDVARGGREATLAAIVEAIDRTAPETKGQLATEVDISEQYLSELLQELKRDGVVRKAYVVDHAAVYENAAAVSRLYGSVEPEGGAAGDRSGCPDGARAPTPTRQAGAATDGPAGASRPDGDDEPVGGAGVDSGRRFDADEADDEDDDDGAGVEAEAEAESGVQRPAPTDRPAVTRGDERGPAVLSLLARLDEVTATQYEAARRTFVGEEPDHPPGALESLANERYSAVLSELKSFALTTDWPGPRVAADLATVATDIEVVGDRACFVADVVASHSVAPTGVVADRVADVFEAGGRIHGDMQAILFECDLSAREDLVAREETIHRDLDELFELITAYDREVYGYLSTVTRALERAIHYWGHAAEIAVSIHGGLAPEHARI